MSSGRPFTGPLPASRIRLGSTRAQAGLRCGVRATGRIDGSRACATAGTKDKLTARASRGGDKPSLNCGDVITCRPPNSIMSFP